MAGRGKLAVGCLWMVACRGSAADAGSTSAPLDLAGSSSSSSGSTVADGSSGNTGNTTVHSDLSAGDETAAPDLPPGAEIGPFQLTYYWVAAQADHPGRPTATLYDPRCEVLAMVSEDFADAIALEGTGRLDDGRLLNYDGPCRCPSSPCFFEADARHPWGYGVQNLALAPYRSVAVDTKVLSIGTPIWIAELDGVTMPGEAPWGGFVHDGCVVPMDVGGGIRGAHIDFFVGLRASYRSLDAALGLKAITVHDGGPRCARYSD